jgi:DNA-binding MarR family transcriptional regulator
MNDKSAEFLERQTQRLRDLITEMVRCCEGRNLLEMKRFSLPTAELKCLTLFKGEKYLTVKGMAQKLGVAKSRVTLLIDSLAKKELVNKIDDPADARVKLISLSAKGKALTDEIEEFQEGLYQEVLLRLETQERTEVISHLGILTSVMEEVRKKFST